MVSGNQARHRARRTSGTVTANAASIGSASAHTARAPSVAGGCRRCGCSASAARVASRLAPAPLPLLRLTEAMLIDATDAPPGDGSAGCDSHFSISSAMEA